LLEQSLRLDAIEQIDKVIASAAPFTKDGGKNYLSSLERESRDIIDEIEEGQDYTAEGLTELKQFFSS